MALSLKGLSDAEKKAAIEAEFTKMADELTSLSGVADLKRLTELRNSLVATNQIFEKLGLTTYDISIIGARAAETLIKHFENLDTFVQASAYYYQTYYSAAEKAAFNTQTLTEQLNALGISTVPKTKAQFRQLVAALREMGDDKSLAALLKIAPLFAQIDAAYRDSLDSSVASAKTKLAEAERAAKSAYDVVVKSIEADKKKVIDEWKSLLNLATEATKKAADDLDRRYKNVTTVVVSLSAGLTQLSDVAADKAGKSKSVLDSLNSALSDRTALRNAQMLRKEALGVVRSGDRDKLDSALSALGQDSRGQHSDQISWARAYAQETAAIDVLRERTKDQLSIEEQSLKALEGQQSQLTTVSELLKKQIAIATGQSVSLQSAVAAIFGSNSRLGDISSKTDLVSKITKYVNSGIAGLADKQQQEAITKAAADTQIKAAEEKAQTHLAALNGTVSGILKLNRSTLSVADSVSGLDSSIVNLTAAQYTLSSAQKASGNQRLKELRTQTEMTGQILALQQAHDKQKRIAALEKQLAASASAARSRPDKLSITGKLGQHKNWRGRNEASYVYMSDGKHHTSRGGSVAQELAAATRDGQTRIDARNREIAAWNKQNNAMVIMREQIRKLGGVPKYAAGGAHVGGLRIVGEHGPELENTGPSRIHSNAQTSRMLDNRDVVQAIGDLRREVAELRSEHRQLGLGAEKQRNRLVRNSDEAKVVGLKIKEDVE
jgi:hypothetical protein